MSRKKRAENARLDRAHLMQFNTEKMEQVYLQARTAGMEQPVVVVIDLRDRLGFRLASILDSGGATLLKEDCRKKGVIPTMVAAMPLTAARTAIGGMTPSGRFAFDMPVPDGFVRVVTIANGGNAYGVMKAPEA